MSVFSKLLNEEWAVCYNCYEIGHIWTPHCTDAALDIFLNAFVESLKMYGPLYLASQAVFVRKFDVSAFKETFKSIFRSSAFLSSNAFTIILFFCFTRLVTGKFYYRVHAYIPTFVGALMAIVIEKPSRRAPLAFYVANIASECLFRTWTDMGIIKPLPHGEIILFSASMSLLLYLIKKQGYGSDPVSLALKLYLGTTEAKSRHNRIKSTPIPRDVFKHESCYHRSSCLSYGLEGFAVPFLATYFGHAGLTCLKRYAKIMADPKSQLTANLFNSRSLKFALFFGSFSAIYKYSSCGLRWFSNGQRDWHALAAGAVAGPSMFFNPNTTITLYLFWKCVETLYWSGVNNGTFKNPVLTANIVYALSVSQIAYCVLLQPKHMRPSYMKFIDQITGHRFHLINRFALNVLVPEAIVGYEDFFPDLDPQFMSKKFMESAFLWLI